MKEPIHVGGVTLAPGERQRLEIPVARLPTGTWLSLPVEVVNGTRPGPHVWLSAAVHGDEINGVEIIRQVLERLRPRQLAGVVLAVPIVNVFGFIAGSRYLPDRRDLNRAFPGSPRGSLAARLAHLFMTEIVSHCTHGLDLHTGSNHRTNLPQIRADLKDRETRRCARAFGAPVIVDARQRSGSLREAATGRGAHVLVYESGEPLRFDSLAIRTGVAGVLRVLAALKMLGDRKKTRRGPAPLEITRSRWVRARRSGILRLDVELGAQVREREPLGAIADAFGDKPAVVRAVSDGMVIGHTNNPLVNQGDAIVHIAEGTPADRDDG